MTKYLTKYDLAAKLAREIGPGEVTWKDLASGLMDNVVDFALVGETDLLEISDLQKIVQEEGDAKFVVTFTVEPGVLRSFPDIPFSVREIKRILELVNTDSRYKDLDWE
jgi:hypothetical protein